MSNNEGIKCFEIECSTLVKDSLMSVEELKEYLETRIKINGRTNKLKNKIDLTCTNESVIVTALDDVRLPKPYLKFLTGKFLYKKELKDWVRVSSSGEKSYSLGYYKVESNKTDN